MNDIMQESYDKRLNLLIYGIEQRFPNCAPRRPGALRDFVRGAAKACKSCCYFFTAFLTIIVV